MGTRVLRIAALVLVLTAVVVWLSSGANRGWTKTSETRKTLDPVTGIEAITYEKRFTPGLDFLAAALVGGLILTGISFLFRRPPNQTKSSLEPERSRP